MNRFHAGAAHLAISVTIATAVFVPIYFIWYPDVLFEYAGGRDLFLLIVGVDVTLGPLITTIVFRHGKPGLKFDLAIIATLQLAALTYGVWTLFEARPVYIAFAKDRFELVRANELAEQSLTKSRIEDRESLSRVGPRVVGTRMPTDPDEKFKLMISGMGGVDVGSYPEFHVPFANVRAQALEKSQSLSKLRQINPAASGEIDRMLVSLGRTEGEVRFLPLRAGKVDLTVIVDARTGDVLRYVSLLPWTY